MLAAIIKFPEVVAE